MSTFMWKITDPSMVKKMKNAQNERSWLSPMFSACGLRWRLKTYPNGHDIEGKGFCGLYLYLLSLPHKISTVVVSSKLSLNETNTIYHGNQCFNPGISMNWGWTRYQLRTSEMQNLNTFTFTVSIEILGVFDTANNDITRQFIQSQFIPTHNEETKQSELESQSNVVSQEQQLMEVRFQSITMEIDEMMISIQDLQRVDVMQLQMNEQQNGNNDDRINKLLEEVQSLKQAIKELSLSNQLDLQAIGIEKVVHRLKILRRIVKSIHNTINNNSQRKNGIMR